jgi:hypothetical protein
LNQDELCELIRALQWREVPNAVSEVQPHVEEVMLQLIGPLAWGAWILMARSGGSSVSDCAIVPAPARYHAIDAVKAPGRA